MFRNISVKSSDRLDDFLAIVCLVIESANQRENGLTCTVSNSAGRMHLSWDCSSISDDRCDDLHSRKSARFRQRVLPRWNIIVNEHWLSERVDQLHGRVCQDRPPRQVLSATFKYAFVSAIKGECQVVTKGTSASETQTQVTNRDSKCTYDCSSTVSMSKRVKLNASENRAYRP